MKNHSFQDTFINQPKDMRPNTTEQTQHRTFDCFQWQNIKKHIKTNTKNIFTREDRD